MTRFTLASLLCAAMCFCFTSDSAAQYGGLGNIFGNNNYGNNSLGHGGLGHGGYGHNNYGYNNGHGGYGSNGYHPRTGYCLENDCGGYGHGGHGGYGHGGCGHGGMMMVRIRIRVNPSTNEVTVPGGCYGCGQGAYYGNKNSVNRNQVVAKRSNNSTVPSKQASYRYKF